MELNRTFAAPISEDGSSIEIGEKKQFRESDANRTATNQKGSHPEDIPQQICSVRLMSTTTRSMHQGIHHNPKEAELGSSQSG